MARFTLPRPLPRLTVRSVLAAALALATALPAAAGPVEVRPGVTYAGTLSPAGSPRGKVEALVLDLASAWAACNPALMKTVLADDVEFAYPTTRVVGLDKVLADLDLFCKSAKDTSIYLPADAFYIDLDSGRVAAELQFRTFQRGARQSVNDVWVATVKNGKIAVIKEYLDGRVKNLQAQGVLELEESPATLAPWPARTAQWKDCFPVLKVEPTNTCPAK